MLPMVKTSMVVTALLIAVQTITTTATSVEISNMLPRYNTSGQIMDAHDGSYSKWNTTGPWYYYAMGYGDCMQGGDMCHGCGYGYSWIGVWTSETMANGTWTLQRDARDASWPHAVYFRVHVVYNPKTKLYILWVNVIDQSHPGDFYVGTSTTPEGPFVFKQGVNVGRKGAGDFDILVDDDGAAYIIYTCTGGNPSHTMGIERLSDDWLMGAMGTAYPIAPPTPPTPTPPGISLVGHGACRDDAMLEPPFFTNEHTPLQAKTTEAECLATCAQDAVCTGVSYCGLNPGCHGACHIYQANMSRSSSTPPPWSFSKGEGGDANHITKVTTESWWTCYSKASGVVDTLMASDGLASSTSSSSSTHVRYSSQKRLVHEDNYDSGVVARSSSTLTSDPYPRTNISSGVIGFEFVEAPVIFKRKGIYYALFGNCCCFCGHGSGAGVYTSTTPLGPWIYHENIACTKPVGSGCGCGMDHKLSNGTTCDNYGFSLTKAQQNFVIQIPSTTADGGIEYVWTGDRWQSAASGIKAQDLQYWSVLKWVAGPGGVDLPVPFTWEDTITIEV
eukprot:m.152877 g.152877  ORF g.152877 m.152877 type:complete len:559 (+) comp30817_c2_seq3:120-1796(+)